MKKPTELNQDVLKIVSAAFAEIDLTPKVAKDPNDKTLKISAPTAPLSVYRAAMAAQGQTQEAVQAVHAAEAQVYNALASVGGEKIVAATKAAVAAGQDPENLRLKLTLAADGGAIQLNQTAVSKGKNPKTGEPTINYAAGSLTRRTKSLLIPDIREAIAEQLKAITV